MVVEANNILQNKVADTILYWIFLYTILQISQL